jgi:dihydroxy-acid dehydratase
VTADDMLVLKNIGPKGAPACPRRATLPIPRSSISRAGVKDMVRISDGRMSGTAFGTIVLHVTPESAVGGPLALVRQHRRPHPSPRRTRCSSASSTPTICGTRTSSNAISPPI